MIVCPECKGSKTQPCYECDGTGNCYHCRDGACPNCEGLKTTECHECDGSGEVPEED